MGWKKKGLIIKPGQYEWMVTHAQNPFVEKIDDRKCYVHFAGRDQHNIARGGFAVIEICENIVLNRVSCNPTLTIGELGCFDDWGAMPSCIIDHDGIKYMYYTGWKREISTPFSFFIGLAISEDNGKNYRRYSKAPIVGRTKETPYLTGSPWVIKEDSMWRMWFVAGTGWEVSGKGEKPKHYYHICYAESKDGIRWNNDGLICIPLKSDEYALARPVVFKEDGLYRMWYCCRGGLDAYRAGYAESEDGLLWTRSDNIGIDVSEEGWDSEMICYPYVFNFNGKKYMLYNGNGYGRTGIGYAVCE